MNKYSITAENFSLTLELEPFKNDDCGFLHINVKSDNFSAKAELDIFVNDFEKFICSLKEMYKTLEGEAIIKELYGVNQFIKVKSLGYGHFSVNGALASNGFNNHSQFLAFENDFDQTSLKDIEAVD